MIADISIEISEPMLIANQKEQKIAMCVTIKQDTANPSVFIKLGFLRLLKR